MSPAAPDYLPGFDPRWPLPDVTYHRPWSPLVQEVRGPQIPERAACHECGRLIGDAFPGDDAVNLTEWCPWCSPEGPSAYEPPALEVVPDDAALEVWAVVDGEPVQLVVEEPEPVSSMLAETAPLLLDRLTRRRPPVFVGSFEPGSDEWHAARANGIGGSEVAAVLGLSPFESPFSLWHRKAGNIGPAEETPAMEWGTRLEDAIAAKFCEEHRSMSWPAPGTWCHPDRPWQIANPDRVSGDPGAELECLEVKHPGYDDGWGEAGTDQIPIYYRCQGMWYLDVLGARRCHFAVLIGACDYREYVIEYDAEEAGQLIDAADEFLQSVRDGNPPDLDSHSATYRAVKELHPEIDGADVDVPDHLARPFIVTAATLANAKELEAEARTRLADFMGNSRRAMWGGKSIATRQNRNGGTPYVVAGRNLTELLPLIDPELTDQEGTTP